MIYFFLRFVWQFLCTLSLVMSPYLGLEKFSFKKNMAIKLREIERERDATATIQDLINAYFNLNKILNSEEKTYEWNHFVKNFFNDENSKKFDSKMKVASILWNNVRQSSNKKYDSSLKNIKIKFEIICDKAGVFRKHWELVLPMLK